DCLTGGRTETYQQLRLNKTNFRFHPWATRSNVTCTGLLVNAPLAARLPLKVFHRVCDINFSAIDAGVLQRPVQDLARRTNEGLSSHILVVARLFTDHHDAGVFGTSPEYSLRGIFVERAGRAALGRGRHLGQTVGSRDRRWPPDIVTRPGDDVIIKSEA